MDFQKIITPVLGVILVAAAWRAYGWAGVAVAAGGIVMWGLLHFTRMTQVLKRAAGRPIGYVGSAVMLNAKLKPGINMLHVLALTRALGERLSAEGQHPEVYRWTDDSASQVTCEFADGRLTTWSFERPGAPPDDGPAPVAGGAPADR